MLNMFEEALTIRQITVCITILHTMFIMVKQLGIDTNGSITIKFDMSVLLNRCLGSFVCKKEYFNNALTSIQIISVKISLII